uniref:NADH-ubiquinone oxidoreductase chain 2 n=1 Tax=Proasellus granadensis TaxID=1281974 RepID=A0A485M6X9_9CRUS|nr:NADH dehydrogenase subunit 2 [Proasellus granadensis]
MVFMLTLSLGIFVMLMSKTWFSVWLGLEMNLLSFLPMILLSSSTSSEGGLKYFLIQALGSLLILQTSFSWSLIPLPYLFFTVPLLLKLGAAPLHFWLPGVAKTLTWRMNMILLTVQKTGPLYLLATVSATHTLPLIIISMFSTIIGALGGLNEMDLRKLLAFSSINHMGWMMVGMTLTQTHWVLYFMTYIITSLSLIMSLNSMNILSLNQLLPKGKNNMLIMLLLLSLGGFPPLLGFAPKWAILMSSVSLSLPLSFLLITMSMVTLYYYIRTGLVSLTFKKTDVKLNLPGSSKPQTLLAFINVAGGLLYMFMWSSLTL